MRSVRRRVPGGRPVGALLRLVAIVSVVAVGTFGQGIPAAGSDHRLAASPSDAATVVSSDPLPAGLTEDEVRDFWTPARMRRAEPRPLLEGEGVPDELLAPEGSEGPAIVVPPVRPGSGKVPVPQVKTLGAEEGLGEATVLLPGKGVAQELSPKGSEPLSGVEKEIKKPLPPEGDATPDPLLAPANDNFANAEVLTGSSDSATGTNADATWEPGEPDHAGVPGGRSVWYRWQAPASGYAHLETCESNFDTLLAVYTGSAVNALTEVDSNDDSCDVQSEVLIPVNGGITYRIAVDGYGGDTGNIVLELDFSAGPSNDDFADAEVLTGSSDTATGTNEYGTKEPGEPDHAGIPGGASVWYRWQAPTTEVVIMDTCNSDFDTVLAVYTGSTVSGLTEIASNDDEEYGCGVQSMVSFPATAGTTYRIAVDGFGLFDGEAETGTVGLTLDRPLIPFNRYEVTDTTATPARTHGKIFGVLGPYQYVCSATVVTTETRSVVFTAGHCVNDPPYPNGGGLGWASQVVFVPGYQYGWAPYGSFVATNLTSLSGWTVNGNFAYDMGAATLSRSEYGQLLQDAVGARGIAFNQPRSQYFQSWGYPAAPPFDGERLWVCESPYGGDDAVPSGPSTMAIGCDMTGGSSGGGWLVDSSYLNSVNSYGYAGLWAVMFGPYFGDAAQGLYDAVSGVDNVPPNTRITRHPKKTITITGARISVRFAFRANEAGCHFKCKKDGQRWKACTSPLRYRVGVGRHTFLVYAIDGAGNRDLSPARYTFRVRRV